MEAIKEVEFEITGTCPIKFNRFTTEVCPDNKRKEAVLEFAKNKVYRDSKGFIAIPSNAIKAVIREACSDVGKKMESKKRKQSIKCGVFMSDEFFSTGKKEADGMAEDVVVNRSGKQEMRFLSYRPYLKAGWKVSGKMSLIGLEPSFVKDLLSVGLMRYGLLSHRPEFGRAEVTKFK